MTSFILSPRFLQRIDFSRFKTVYAKKSDTGAVQFYKDQVQDYLNTLPNTLVSIRVRGIQGRTKLFARSRPGTASTPTPSTPHYGKHRIRFRGKNKVYGTDFPPTIDDESSLEFETSTVTLPDSRYYKVEVTTAAFDSTVNQIRLVELDRGEAGVPGYSKGIHIDYDFLDDYGILYREYSPTITRTRSQLYPGPLEMTTHGTVSESSSYLHT